MLAGRLLQGTHSVLAKVAPARGETRCWISGSSLGFPLLEDPSRTRGGKGEEGRKREEQGRRVEESGGERKESCDPQPRNFNLYEAS